MAPRSVTLLQACAEASRHGRVAMIRTALAELVDLLKSAVRVRTAWPPLPSGRGPRRVSSSKGPAMLRSIDHDILMGFRSLMASKTHTALAAGILAAGIGVNAAVFSIADSILFRPMPFQDSARFIGIWNKTSTSVVFPGFSPALLLEWRRQSDLFDRLKGSGTDSFVLVGNDATETIAGAKVTPGLLAMLGVKPLHGRLFVEGDGRQGNETRVILSERLWRSRFGADPAIVGRAVRLNEIAFEVVGILPASFYFPYEPQRLWTPYDPQQPPASSAAPRLDAFARLAPGVTRAVASEQIEARGVEVAKAAGGDGRTGAQAGFSDIVDTKTTKSVWSLVGAVGFLLLIVCANLANVSLSRALSRTRDLAVRSALGASRARLIRESLSESLILGVAGAAGGLLIAKGMLALTVQVMPRAMTFSSLNRIDLDARVLVFTAVAGVLTAVLFGLPSAIAASRPRIGDALKSESRSSTDSRNARMVRSSLIVAEVALSVILLAGAALTTRSFVKLASLDQDFDPANLISVQLGLPTNGYAHPQARYRFTGDFIERVKAIPGVTAVTAGAVPPDSDSISFGKMEFEDKPGVLTPRLFLPYFTAWPGYFQAIGIPIRDGRPFTADEPHGTVIVNEGFAAEFFPGESAVGKRIRWQRGQWQTIVGVAGEVRQTGVDESRSRHEFYRAIRRPAASAAQPPPSGVAIASYTSILVRAENPALVIPLLRAAVRDADRRIALGDVALVEHLLAEEIARPRLILLLMSVFAVMALVLSAAGIYGVLSMTVVQRLREIGVRMALGAAPRDVGRLVLLNGITLTAIGLAIGLAGSFYVLFDPASMALVALLLGIVALAAAWRPARRAMRVDPVGLLRSS